MKRNALPVFLTVVAVICGLLTAVMGFLFHGYSKELRLLQAQYLYMNTMRSTVQSLAAECSEYSKQHPGIDPILQQVGIKTKATNAPSVLTPLPTLPK